MVFRENMVIQSVFLSMSYQMNLKALPFAIRVPDLGERFKCDVFKSFL
jgi:hypothetical protein